MAGRRRDIQRFTWAAMIRRFIDDKNAAGDFNSRSTERNYTITLEVLADYVEDLDPRFVDREDVRRCLLHWDHLTTRSVRRAQIVSFFDWMVEEGFRDDNPARGTKRIRRRKPDVVRWTLDEARAFLDAAATTRERRVAYFGVIMGLRLAELLALRGADFQRPGFVRVQGKGKKVRWLPMLADALPVAEEIRRNVAPKHYVIPAERWRNPNESPREKKQLLEKPGSRQAVRTVVIDVAARAGLGHATPHVMRRAFADFIQGAAGDLRLTQEMLGHSSPGTTATYLSGMSPEALSAAVEGLSIRPTQPVALIPMAVEDVGE